MTVRATTSNANLRQTASGSSTALTVLPKGTVLYTHLCTTWCPVTFSGRSGFVAKSLLRF
jgi:uncharacterized protein YraI